MAKTNSGKSRKNGTGAAAKRSTAFSLSTDPLVNATAEEDVHKYEATREPVETPAFEDLGELPQSYGQPTLFLIARDPHWLFSYWDFDAKAFPTAEFFLKIFTADGAEESSIEINPEAKNWYVPVTKPGETYYAQIGYFKGKSWELVAQSERALVPADSVAEEAQSTFATVPFHLTFQRLLEMVKSSMHKGETLIEALARLQGDGRKAVFGGSVAGWTDEQRQVLAALFGKELVDRLGMSSESIDQILRQELLEKLNTESASGIVSQARFAELAAPGESSLFSGVFGALAEAAWGSEVSSWFSAIGSSWSAQPFGEQPREFFMHVNAEVIFYGGTHPDAKVWIDGKQIALNADGSFRFHFKFPDGNYEIPIVAQSPDGVEERSASLTFERATARKGEVGATAQPQKLTTPMGQRS
ncbi:MAG: uncharacterized protein QOD99_678 [Chthoniobacter sp.]|nr:uncharacterized protein [Chthoniobacter sp.]